ncbi:kynurenine formamidase [Melghirimyces profundicolus]|uniref:Kynurenine formamidase n=1 Tax=Melghirimyces profundicolus TaxID=1242148 RepID=A0A2T6BQF0_9BACL|nr:cyclase family protein [Melghirimyces profundicolus]PTX58279.1 kynurenine formamidase [Melghirimyces profundicolus]
MGYKVYDVSMTIHEEMAVYKNKAEKKPEIEVIQDFDTSPARESRIHLDVHTGTHVDAPLHMLPDGGTMKTLEIEKLTGPCRLLDLTHVTGGIGRADLEGVGIREGDFVLLKTRNSDREDFDFEFVFLSQDGAEYLTSIGVRGVGIDALGIERGQPGHPTHKTLFRAGILIVEGLRLKDVPVGEYFLTAVPIKLRDTEAAPARVLLFEGLSVAD